MKERILEIMMKNDLTALKFAAILNVQPSNISHILSGRNKPSFDFIEKILTQFSDISPDWLILGSGDMYRAAVGNVETEEQPDVPVENSGSFSHSLFDEVDDDSDSSDVDENNDITNVITSNEPEKSEDNSVSVTNVITENESVKPQIDSELTDSIDLFDKEIDKIVVFYKDRRFRTYYPE